MKIFAPLALCLGMLLAASAAFADGGTGVQVTVKNVGSAEAQATISRNGMTESDNPVTKTVSSNNAATFTKQETAHDSSERFPLGWELEISASSITNCRYKILLNDNACSVQTGTANCAQVQATGDCALEFTIKPK
jgi:hypothetical protein